MTPGIDTRTDAGAILLAGGRGSRMGGVRKPLLDLGGTTLLRRAVTAARGCHPLTIVAEVLDPGLDGVTWVREDPPFSGPAAGTVAGLASWPAPAPEWTLLLACDLTNPEAAVRRLREAAALLPTDTDGVCLGDASGRPQWLTGLYRTAPLRRHAEALPGAGRDAPARLLVDDLAIAVVAAPGAETGDVDTWEDLEKARRALGADPREQRPDDDSRTTEET